MQITEVRVKLCEENHERLLAFCSITFDGAFVVRDLKIIEGTRGLFVAMPSRKLTDRCSFCGCKNHLRSRFCNGCGHRLDESRALRDLDGRAKLHADIAHPIHSGAREQIQSAVAKAYAEERDRAKLPGYVCRYDDFDLELDDLPPLSAIEAPAPMPLGNFTPHSGHPATKGPHHQETITSEEPFGSGIL